LAQVIRNRRARFVSALCGQVSLVFMVTPPTIQAANLGMADSLILMVLALVVFGPRRLPQIGRQIGKLMYEFRKASNDFKFQMEEELRSAEDADRRKQEEERQRTLALSAPAVLPGEAGLVSQAPEAGPGAPEGELLSQVPEAGPGAPVVGSQGPDGARAGIVSPYPGEELYPSVFPGVTEPAETYPRIQPPATGEQVEAARPARHVGEAMDEAGLAISTPASPEASLESNAAPTAVAETGQTEQASPGTEPTNQNG
jgi:sec-independent protein translocase protein TatB